MPEARSAVLAKLEPGKRLAIARREAGLAQKDLAEQMGVSVWRVDQLESGREDLRRYLPEIAAVVDRPPDWFAHNWTAVESEASPLRRAVTHMRPRIPRSGVGFVSASLGTVVLIRFFTEVVPIVPRAANFIDVPIFLVLVLAAATRPMTRSTREHAPFLVLSLLFVVISVVAMVANPTRVEPGPTLVFIYGFLAPVGVYAAVFRLWPVGRALSFSRLLVALGLIELLVVFTIDLPKFLIDKNPDVVSGTFGTNAYQLVFFLLVFTALLAAIFSLEKSRAVARLAPVLFVAVLATIFLAQYRLLLISTVLTLIFVGLLLGLRVRVVVAGAMIAVSFVITLSFVASHFPNLYFSGTISSIKQNPTFYASKRFSTVNSVARLYSDQPIFMMTGTGPGTFSSRGWQTFAFAGSKSHSNVQGTYALALTGGRPYQTDVSDRYVLPQILHGEVIGNSRAVTLPFSSYLSLLAEVGLVGFAVMILIYVEALRRAWVMARIALTNRREGDALPALLVAAAAAFFLLLQMAVFDNWLEVTRVTFPSWMILGVAAKEFEQRFARA